MAVEPNPSNSASGSPFGQRLNRLRDRMDRLDVDAVLLSVGADLPWLCGYDAMPLERLTMLVVPRGGHPTLVVPALEAPRVIERSEVFRMRPWNESEDPVRIVAELTGPTRRVAIGDRTWARFLVDLQAELPRSEFLRASEVTGALRAVKDDAELAALRSAAAAADRVAVHLMSGSIPLVDRTEAEVSRALGRALLDEGHRKVNFAIVAAGENAASPHHEPGQRRIGVGEVVLCDFGGTMSDPFGVGYCSDITRCVWTGEPPSDAADIYEVLETAQQAAVEAVRPGVSASSVDATARTVIAAAGLGDRFVHRTGHGIGVEEHEDPYVVEGNDTELVVGHAFSIEPGVYLPGRFGFRLEDIVVVDGAGGVERLNLVDRSLTAIA